MDCNILPQLVTVFARFRAFLAPVLVLGDISYSWMVTHPFCTCVPKLSHSRIVELIKSTSVKCTHACTDIQGLWSIYTECVACRQVACQGCCRCNACCCTSCNILTSCWNSGVTGGQVKRGLGLDLIFRWACSRTADGDLAEPTL